MVALVADIRARQFFSFQTRSTRHRPDSLHSEWCRKRFAQFVGLAFATGAPVGWVTGSPWLTFAILRARETVPTEEDEPVPTH
jgi:hypothetical protein